MEPASARKAEGRLGDDAAVEFYRLLRFGQIIREKLTKNNVNFKNSIVTEENSTLAIVSLNEQGVPTYSFYVNGTSDWGWTKEELPTQEQLDKEQINCIQFGCLTMAMEPGNLVIEKWAKDHYDQKSLTISHDINMRPALGFDRTQERNRVERVNSFSHLIKASDEDIYWLYDLPEGSDVDPIVAKWIGDSGRHVFVTRGGDGVSVYRPAADGSVTRFDVPSRKINVVDTVGAGDTFCANLLGQLSDIGALGTDPFDRLANLSDEDLRGFVHTAGIAASITCERAGCEPPTKEDLAAVLATL